MNKRHSRDNKTSGASLEISNTANAMGEKSSLNRTNKSPDTRNKLRLIGLVFILTSFFLFGLVLGMLIEQKVISMAAQKAFSMTDIQVDININETKLAQEFNKTVVPSLIAGSGK